MGNIRKERIGWEVRRGEVERERQRGKGRINGKRGEREIKNI